MGMGSQEHRVMVAELFSSLPVTLLLEGGIFVTLAVGWRLGRRLRRWQR